MKRLLFFVLCIVLLAPVLVSAEPDAEGSKDHPLFNRMSGYYIQRYEVKEFDSLKFQVNKKETAIEGHFIAIVYGIQPGKTESSRVQILRNYENAIKKIGGKVTGRNDDGDIYMTVAKDGKEFWVHVNAYITSQYSVDIIEKEAMTQEITANAGAFANDIKTTGHAAVYGIYFDTGKAELKPASDTALAEIAKMFKSNSALKIFVVGHTDNVGAVAANMKLSEMRADAVIKALVSKYGIAAARLKGFGVGQLAPVLSNDSEDGRAKNRRVELVKQ